MACTIGIIAAQNLVSHAKVQNMFATVVKESLNIFFFLPYQVTI